MAGNTVIISRRPTPKKEETPAVVVAPKPVDKKPPVEPEPARTEPLHKPELIAAAAKAEQETPNETR